jgi:hypothetical protein
MAPRKTTEAAVAAADLPAGQYDAIMAKLSILDTVTEKLEALEALPAKIASLEKLLHEANAKTAALQAEILTKDRTIFDLRVKVNSLEQYNRKWSVRINNLTLPYGDETDTTLVMETVYNKALLPILEGALRSKHITKIPEVHELLETAHILPAKNDNRPKPIIARFYSRNLRSLIFRLKREYAPTTTSPPSSASSSSSAHPGKKTFRYPIYEDLTKDTFNLLQALLKDERTGPVWTVSGNIRYKLAGDTAVKKVSSVYESVDKILAK